MKIFPVAYSQLTSYWLVKCNQLFMKPFQKIFELIIEMGRAWFWQEIAQGANCLTLFYWWICFLTQQYATSVTIISFRIGSCKIQSKRFTLFYKVFCRTRKNTDFQVKRNRFKKEILIRRTLSRTPQHKVIKFFWNQWKWPLNIIYTFTYFTIILKNKTHIT